MSLLELGLTLEQAKNLTQGDEIHNQFLKNADGTCQRWRVTSVKTWKRDPNRIRVGLKRGLKEYGSLDERNLEEFHTDKRCPWKRLHGPVEGLPPLIGLDKDLDKAIDERLRKA